MRARIDLSAQTDRANPEPRDLATLMQPSRAYRRTEPDRSTRLAEVLSGWRLPSRTAARLPPWHPPWPRRQGRYVRERLGAGGPLDLYPRPRTAIRYRPTRGQRWRAPLRRHVFRSVARQACDDYSARCRLVAAGAVSLPARAEVGRRWAVVACQPSSECPGPSAASGAEGLRRDPAVIAIVAADVAPR